MSEEEPGEEPTEPAEEPDAEEPKTKNPRFCPNIIPIGHSYNMSDECHAPLRLVDGVLKCPHCDLGEPRPYVNNCPHCSVMRHLHRECWQCGDDPVEGMEPEEGIEPIKRLYTPPTRTQPEEPEEEEEPVPEPEPAPEPDKPTRPVTVEDWVGQSIDARHALRDLLAPEEADAFPFPETSQIAKQLGENLEQSLKYLKRTSLPGDIEDQLEDLQSDTDRDTENKIHQIDRIEEDLSDREHLVEERRRAEILKERARFATIAIDRQLESKRNQFEHWLHSERFEMGAPTFNPDELLRLEDESSFAEETYNRLSTICLATTCREYGVTDLLYQSYLNEPMAFIFAAEEDMDKHLTTFRGKANVALWSTNNQIAMISVVKIGEFLGYPVLKMYETAENIRRRIGRPDISTILNTDGIRSKLAFGEGTSMETSEELKGLRKINIALDDEAADRDIKPDIIAQEMHEAYQGMNRPEKEYLSGFVNWVKKHWLAVTLVAIAILITILIIILLTGQ